MLGLIVGAAFAVPSFVLPPDLGGHWPLDGDERAALAKALRDALDALPGSKAKALMKWLEQFAPFLALAVTAGTITIPRVMLTRSAMAQRREDAERARRNGTPPDAPGAFVDASQLAAL